MDDETVRSTDDISTWDLEFLKIDQSLLMELIIAANFMNIPVSEIYNRSNTSKLIITLKQ